MMATAVPQLIDRSKIFEGMNISRRANARISKHILLATGRRTLPLWHLATLGFDAYVETIDGLTHDAKIVRDPKDGRLKIGDALAGKGCVLTEIEEWERGCLEDGDRIVPWVPAGATELSCLGSARWWMGHVHGHDYDKVAITRLGVKAVFGDWLPGRVGLPTHFYCTEGVADADAIGGGKFVYFPEKNPDPGLTFVRILERRAEIVDCLTEAGKAYRVRGLPWKD